MKSSSDKGSHLETITLAPQNLVNEVQNYINKLKQAQSEIRPGQIVSHLRWTGLSRDQIRNLLESISDGVSLITPLKNVRSIQASEEASEEACEEASEWSEGGAGFLKKITAKLLKKDVSTFKVGDTVKVHTRVIESGKERTKVFEGIVIARNGSGINETFTVRKVSYGEGVERVFRLHRPNMARIEVIKPGKVRRARLHYLRGRKGSVVRDMTQNEPQIRRGRTTGGSSADRETSG